MPFFSKKKQTKTNFLKINILVKFDAKNRFSDQISFQIICMAVCNSSKLRARSLIPYFTVPGPVRNLTTENISSHSWILSWNPQTTNNCPTEDYLIEYELVDFGLCIANRTRRSYANVTNTSITIDELWPYSTYIVSVYSRNNKGSGLKVSIEGVTGESGK